MIYELFLEGQLADIRQDLGMQLSYNIDDVNKYGSRDTSFSKTIVLPGTARNNKLFGFVGELGSNNPYAPGAANIDANFNVAQTTKAELRANGLLLLKGVFRLTGIIHERGHIEYEGNLFGELGGFIAAIGGRKLEDLNFNDYNHVLTRDNIVNSWDNKITKDVIVNFSSVGSGIYIISVQDYIDLKLKPNDQITITNAVDSSNNKTYTVITYNAPVNPFYGTILVLELVVTRSNDAITISYPVEQGKGYYYPLIDYGTYSAQKIDYDYRTFRPALYVKEYMDKIFEGSGYTYQSSFFDSAFFKKLIIPNNTKDFNFLTKDQLNASIIDSDYTTYQSGGNPAVRGILAAAWQNDPKFYNEFTSFTGTNFLRSSQTLSGGEQYPNSVLTYVGTESVYVKGRVTFKCEFYNDYDPFYGSPTSPYRTLTFNVSFEGFGDNLGTKTFGSYSTQQNKWLPINIDYEFEGQLDPNKQFKIYFERKIIFSSRRVLVRNIVSDINIESVNAIPTPILLNNPINLNVYIPRNILQKDFFTWIMKMFNLYITEDKVREKHLLIEPYVDYYDLSDSEDWTYKVARDKAWNIKPMGMLTSRFYEYKFKDDNDFYNENYKKKFNQNYGDRLEDTLFQFAKEKQTIEIGFSPSPLIQYSEKDKVACSIHKKTKGNSVDQEERMDSNIRILMAKKMTGVTSWYIVNTGASQNSTPQQLGAALTAYGYAGHFDDPVNPTKDINFGAASEIYFDPNTYPTNNLFNDYWSAYIAEIADKDSKILSCHVYLNDLDIAQLDFSKPVFIDGVLWRINKVMDYDSTSGELTKVELLKVINNG